MRDSLSKFTSLNFAIHTLAQPKTVSSSNYFSFVIHTYSSETDGRIKDIKCDSSLVSRPTSTSGGAATTDFYKCVVTREDGYDNNEVLRTFDEFVELYQLLLKTYPALRFGQTPPLVKFKETRNPSKRRLCVEQLIGEIVDLQAEISQVLIDYFFLVIQVIF